MGCRGVELVSRFGVEVSRPGLRGLPSEVNALCAAPRQTLGRGPSEAKISQERPQRRHRVRVKPSVPPSQGSDPSSQRGV